LKNYNYYNLWLEEEEHVPRATIRNSHSLKIVN
jgi:hypothetical protein